MLSKAKYEYAKVKRETLSEDASASALIIIDFDVLLRYKVWLTPYGCLVAGKSLWIE